MLVADHVQSLVPTLPPTGHVVRVAACPHSAVAARMPDVTGVRDEPRKDAFPAEMQPCVLECSFLVGDHCVGVCLEERSDDTMATAGISDERAERAHARQILLEAPSLSRRGDPGARELSRKPDPLGKAVRHLPVPHRTSAD